MKHNVMKTLVAVALLAGTTLVMSCKPEPGYDPIDATFETPRHMAAYEGSLYVTCYSPRAVVRIDTATMKPTGICELGDFNPEGIAAVDGKLYIASSAISDENYQYTYDNKVYVVDPETMKVLRTINVGKNPAKVVKVDNTHFAVNCLGDYATDFGGTYIVNTSNDEVTPLNVALYNMTSYNGDIYGYTSPYGTLKFYRIGGNSHTATEILGTWSSSDNPYGISINTQNGDIVVTTDGNYMAAGDCYVFANDGTQRMTPTQLSALPSKAVGVDNNTLIVLNEGNWGSNDASLSRVNVSNGTADIHWFDNANGRGLGDVAQDILVYGKRAYVTVSFSNSIESIDLTSGTSRRTGTAK